MIDGYFYITAYPAYFIYFAIFAGGGGGGGGGGIMVKIYSLFLESYSTIIFFYSNFSSVYS